MVFFNHLIYVRIKDIIHFFSSLHSFWSSYKSIINNSFVTSCFYKVNKLGYVITHFVPNTLIFFNIVFNLTILYSPNYCVNPQWSTTSIMQNLQNPKSISSSSTIPCSEWVLVIFYNKINEVILSSSIMNGGQYIARLLGIQQDFLPCFIHKNQPIIWHPFFEKGHNRYVGVQCFLETCVFVHYY